MLNFFFDMCHIDTATEYETAKKLLESKYYDIVVLDIMGVNGYELLAVAHKKGIPAVMLTAHAPSADNFAKFMDEGDCAYLPTDRLFEIDVFLTDVLEDSTNNSGVLGKWFDCLKGYHENKFGPGWLDEYKGAWH